MENKNKTQIGAMSSLEFICLSIFLGGMLFYLDIWLSSMVKEPPKQVPTKETKHTREEKAILCTGGGACNKMAELIVYEARSEPLEGKRLVVQVVMNRVEHKSWPDSIENYAVWRSTD